MRRKLVVGNWKMNLTQAQAISTVEAFVKLVDSKAEVDVGICPPYLSLAKVKDLLKGTHISLGAQDVFWVDSGAFTGRVSPTMVRDAGCEYCIIGHSETRGRFGKLEIPESTVRYFAETDETVNLKLKALLFHSLKPILCVGETLDEREAGKTDEVIREQLKGAFAGIDGSEFMEGVVAYEPVWAIGTGKVCDAEEANRVCGVVRSTLAELLGPEVAEAVRVLYGGSVKGSNAGELFSKTEIDGGLVGGASLDPQDFSRIVLSA